MKGVKHTLTPAEEAWLVRHFRHTRNAELCERFGISETALHRFARHLGLAKSRQFRMKMQRNAAYHARQSHLAFNTYPPKGYRIPRSEEYQFRPGERTQDRIGEERWREARRKAVETRKETFRMERARVTFGLPQKTKMNVKRQPRQKVLDRCYLKRRGYVIDELEVTAYWTPETRRATRMEARPRRFYKFAKHPDLG